MTFDLTILGSSSATPAHNRNPSSQLLNINEKLYLIDCGEGTQTQLYRYRIKPGRIDQIFITHLHGDHFFGLMGLLSTLHLNGRTKEMDIFGPPPLLEIIELQLKHSETMLRYPLQFHPLRSDKSEVIFQNADVTVETIILEHRIPCTGFLFREIPRKRRILNEKMAEHQVPLEYIPLLKEGKDYQDKSGKTILNSELTREPLPARSFAYCTDTIYTERIISQVSGVDMLYHEATFMHDMIERARETYHTTALQAGEFAKKANVKKLIIGHFSARYKELDPVLAECRTEFPNAWLAIEGERYSP